MKEFKAILEDPSTIEWLGSQTPVELLTKANKGFKIRDIDYALISELQEQGFANGVINAMLYFVLVRNRGLRFDEVRELASVWGGVKTVEEAVILGKDAFLEWQKNRPVRLTNSLQGPGWKMNF